MAPEERREPPRPERRPLPDEGLSPEVPTPPPIAEPPPVRHLITGLPSPDALADVVPAVAEARVEIEEEDPPPALEDLASMEMGSNPEGLTQG